MDRMFAGWLPNTLALRECATHLPHVNVVARLSATTAPPSFSTTAKYDIELASTASLYLVLTDTQLSLTPGGVAGVAGDLRSKPAGRSAVRFG